MAAMMAHDHDWTEQRQYPREALLLMAQCLWDGMAVPVRVKVRNIGAGGLMAEAVSPPGQGERLIIELRNLGWISGRVAWTSDQRFGVTFNEKIDPRAVRAAYVGAAPKLNLRPDLLVRRPLAIRLTEMAPDARRLRCI